MSTENGVESRESQCDDSDVEMDSQSTGDVSVSSSSVTRLPAVKDSPSKKRRAPPLNKGDEFASKDDLMQTWAEYSAAEQYGQRVTRSSQTKYYLRCTYESCVFDLKAGKVSSGRWRVSSFVNHDCRFDQRLQAAKIRRDGLSRHVIRAECERLVKSDPKVTASAVAKSIQAKYKVGNLLTSVGRL
jgi:hypothetical protein